MAHKAAGLYSPGASLAFGGAEVQLRILAAELARAPGVEVHVMVAGAPREEPVTRDGVTVWTPLAWDAPVARRAAAFARFLGRVKADVVVQRTLSPLSGPIALLCRARGSRFVYMVANDGETDGTHAVYRRPASRMLSRMTFRLADAVVVQNAYQLHNAAALCARKPALIRSSWPLTEQPPAYSPGAYVLWVSRIDRLYKRPELFLDLAARFPAEPFVMIAAPANDQAAYFEACRLRALAMPNVQFVPGVPFAEMDARYRGAKVLVNTSSSEGFPNTFLQAAANKTPLLSLRVDPDGFVEKHACGFSCGDDTELLAERLAALLRDEALRQRMGENARAYVRENHDARRNAESLLALCRRVVGGKTRKDG